MVKLKEDTIIQKAFKDISDSSWDKIIIRGWSPDVQSRSLNLTNFKQTMLEDNPKFMIKEEFKWGGTRFFSFTNDEVFNDVLKIFTKAKQTLKSRDTMVYLDSSSNGIAPGYLFSNFLLRDEGDNKGNDLFASFMYKEMGLKTSSGLYSICCKIRSKEAFEFLKKYSNDKTIPIVYQAGIDFDDKEFEGTNAPIEPNSTPQPPIPTPQPPIPTPTPVKPDETPEEKVKRLEGEKKDLEDELKNLKDEWDKDFKGEFGDLTVDNLKKLKGKYDEEKTNLVMCKDYTGDLVTVLSDEGVDGDKIPKPPEYKSSIEISPKKPSS